MNLKITTITTTALRINKLIRRMCRRLNSPRSNQQISLLMKRRTHNLLESIAQLKRN